MSSCTLLGDKTVLGILFNLSHHETVQFKDEIANSLISLSLHNERQYQPQAVTVTRPDGKKILFRLFTSNNGPGVKIIVDSISNAAVVNGGPLPSSTGKKEAPGLHGIITLCDGDGIPKGLINADEITAYRTAMSVMIPFAWRSDVSRIVVFGAGRVAMWQLHIAFVLKGEDTQHVTIVNRSRERAERLVAQLQEETSRRRSTPLHCETLSPMQTDYDQKVKASLGVANVVFCSTPSSKPLFPVNYLELTTNPRPCFVSGVGSWQPDMVELDPELIINAAQTGLVVVDDREEAMKSSGEFIQANLPTEKIYELGEVLKAEGPSSAPSIPQSLSSVETGLVVYKSIGVSLTDLAASDMLLKLAEAKGKGVSLSDF